MNVFGGTAIHQFLFDGYTGVTEVVTAWTPELALFKMLEHLPMTGLICSVSVILIIVFFITSSDSGSLVVVHHVVRREAGSARETAHILVQHRRRGRHCPASRRRSDIIAGGLGHSRTSVLDPAHPDDGQHMEGSQERSPPKCREKLT